MTERASPFESALERTRELTITVQGRRTGRPITLPVWFVHEPGALYLLPVQGSRSQWFRNTQANPTLSVRAGEQERTLQAIPMVDASEASRLRARFEAKYGAEQVARHYGPSDALVRIPLAA